MYISEIAPLNLRGGLGTVNQLAVTVGLLTSQVLGVEPLLGTDEGWPYLLGIAVFPSILQLILLPVCPESPRYLLISKGQEQAARDALRRLRNTPHIEDDIEEMRAEDIGIGSVMVLMTLVSIPLMDRRGRRTLHLYGLGGMFIFSIFITISFLVKVTDTFKLGYSHLISHGFHLIIFKRYSILRTSCCRC